MFGKIGKKTRILSMVIVAMLSVMCWEPVPVSATTSIVTTYDPATESFKLEVATDKKGNTAVVQVPGEDSVGNPTYWVLEEFSRSNDGSFSKTFKLPAECPSGTYTVAVIVSGEKATDKIAHVNSTQGTLAMMQINGANSTTFKSVLENVYEDVAVNITDFYAHETALTSLYFKYKPVGNMTLSQFTSHYNQCLALSKASKLNNDTELINFLDSNYTTLGLDYSKFTGLDMDAQKGFLAFVRSAAYQESTINDQLDAWICLADVNAARVGGTGDYEELLLDTYDGIFNLDTSDYEKSKDKNEVIRLVMAKSYTTLSDLTDAFYSAVSSVGVESSGGSGSSSSNRGGGGIVVVGSGTISAPSGETQEIYSTGFVDVSDKHWCAKPIKSFFEKGIICGVGKNMFLPDNAVSRGEFVKMLVGSLFADYQTTSAISFNDVSVSDWYYSYVAKAADIGIVTGYENGNFEPKQTITRQEMAVMVHRSLSILNIQLAEALGDFTDSKDISEYAKESVSLLSGVGILNGMGNGTFLPMGNVSRAQAVKALYEAWNYSNK